MSAQPDLFAARPAPTRPPSPRPAAPAPAGIPDPLSLLPSRPIPWQRLVARAATAEILIVVARLWTGVVMETLNDPRLGRHFLHADGLIQPVEFPDSTHGRCVFLTAAEARALHARAPLVQVGAAGAASMRLRFRRPGEGPCAFDLGMLA